jgi:hypothetical protein
MSVSPIAYIVNGQTIVLGSNQTAAYVFTKPAAGWANMTPTALLSVPSSVTYNGYSTSVSISGNKVVVGVTPQANQLGQLGQGSAYLFTEPFPRWSNMAPTLTLTPSGPTGSDDFGRAVAIDGNTVLVGAPEATVEQGAAYLFGISPPTIISGPVTTTFVGLKYTYQVKSTAVPGAKTTFSLGAHPTGMTIDAASGLISWTPSASQLGAATVTVFATDQFGNVAKQNYTIRVLSLFLIYSPWGPAPTGG